MDSRTQRSMSISVRQEIKGKRGRENVTLVKTEWIFEWIKFLFISIHGRGSYSDFSKSLCTLPTQHGSLNELIAFVVLLHFNKTNSDQQIPHPAPEGKRNTSPWLADLQTRTFRSDASWHIKTWSRSPSSNTFRPDQINFWGIITQAGDGCSCRFPYNRGFFPVVFVSSQSRVSACQAIYSHQLVKFGVSERTFQTKSVI